MQIYKLLYSASILLLLACTAHKEQETESIAADTSLVAIIKPDSILHPTTQQMETKEAQSIYNNFFIPGTLLYVVPTDGALLHREPNEASEVLRSLNFGDSIVVTEHPFSLQEIKSLRLNPVDSFWVKVKSNEQEGYVLSSQVILSKIKNTDAPVHLFLASVGCLNYYAFSPHFNYYAVFKNDNGYVLRIIQPNFFGVHEAWEGLAWDVYGIGIRGDKKAEPLFIFGFEKTLTEGEIKNIDVLPNEGEEIKETSIHNGMTLVAARHNEKMHLTFKSAHGKEIQKLDILHLLWCGDLDGDGKPDFVYAKGDGETGGIFIALSSFAGEHEVVKEVAFFGIGLCC
jgi:hypothetical protein